MVYLYELLKITLARVSRVYCNIDILVNGILKKFRASDSDFGIFGSSVLQICDLCFSGFSHTGLSNEYSDGSIARHVNSHPVDLASGKKSVYFVNSPCRFVLNPDYEVIM